MEPWEYSPAEDLDLSLAERLRCFPREPDILVYAARVTIASFLRLWLSTYHRFRIYGAEHLPPGGRYIIVANHTSHLDALCILSALRLSMIHRIFPAAAQDYFFVSLPRLAMAAVVINALPFSRETNIRQSINLCKHLLENPDSGNVLILFPEGTRSLDGAIADFKPGIGLLVAGTRIPVVPCYLEGACAAWPKGSRLPRPRRVTLHIGTPRTYENLKRGRSSCRSIAEDLRNAVIGLRND